ncbi:hypothetical protein [Falsiroseomonas oryziterrae]|uniref:hypothetical protein n=1 Tax=Falsiroseomonas oryziterrae TaxID=2911368 RepID=UPI001F338A1D|nr:hypothetical protein [Roseomonas sp. NPKOSM-4]
MQAEHRLGLRVLRRVHAHRDRLGVLGSWIVPRTLNPGRLWFLRPGCTPAQVAATLHARGIAHALLGGPGTTPPAARDAAFELLIEDDGAEVVRPFVSDWPIGLPCRIYSTTGLPGFCVGSWTPPTQNSLDGTGFPDEMAVFPPHLSAALLRRAAPGQADFMLPHPEDRFLSFAYRLAYLLGDASGLSSAADGASPTAAPVASPLRGLASAAGLGLPAVLTLEALDEVLARSGWRPPRDVLERLAVHHPWIARRFFAMPGGREAPGFTVFFLRQRAVDAGRAPHIAALLERRGFEILAQVPLDGALRAAAARMVRGGNWGRNGFPESGGDPALLFLTLDLIPRPVGAAEAREQPTLDNGRIHRVKRELRDAVTDGLDPARHYNGVHSSDNSGDAWHIVESLLPDRLASLRAQVAARRTAFATSDEVVADLTGSGERAKVELVRRDGHLAVRKTWRPHALAAMQREVDFLARFASERTELLPPLETGDGWMITPFQDNAFAWRGRAGARLMPLGATRQLGDFIRHLLRHGCDPAELAPERHALIDRTGALRLVGFDGIRQGAEPLPPERATCFAEGRYGRLWYPHTGLSLRSLLHDPPWLQAAKRAVNHPAHRLAAALQGMLGAPRARVTQAIRHHGPRLLRLASAWRRPRAAAPDTGQPAR